LKKFKIFEKHFVWTRTKIINLIILILISIFILSTEVIKIEKPTFLLIFVFVLYLIGLSLKIINFTNIEQLKGKLSGYFILDKNYIKINERIYNLEEIKKIEITGVDWIGLRNTNYILDFNYENGLSNGTENYLILEFINKSILKVQFQRNNACEFKEIEHIIKHYYVKNKIGYLNCVDILCLSDSKQWSEFKQQNKHYS
jgi:hypothetical protein